jgi:transposase
LWLDILLLFRRKELAKSSCCAMKNAMNADLSSLPDDAVISKQDVVELATQYQEKIHYLEDRIRLLQNELFGRKSEKSYPDPDLQLPIFEDKSDHVPEPLADTVAIAAHKRKKRGRKPLPDHLPRVEIIHDLSDEEKICGCGKQKDCIGQEQCEKIDYIPAKVQVQRHIRLKYACKDCEGVDDDRPTVTIAPAPVALIPKSNATEGLLAHIVVSKFADGLPLYRQEKMFSRIGVDLSRATMANWMVKAARCCSPLVELLQNEIRSGPLINMD